MVQSARPDAKTEGKAKRKERYGKTKEEEMGRGRGENRAWEKRREKERVSLTFMFAARVVQENEVKRD